MNYKSIQIHFLLTAVLLILHSTLPAAVILPVQEATLLFDFDDCYSNPADGTNMDYSEFTAISDNAEDLSLSVVNSHLYRNNPIDNKHSCTPGLNGSEGMCVSYDMDCNYNPGSDRAVRFDILVSPANNQASVLSELKFYQKAPEQFDWINGPDGDNNYPTFYAIRVLKNDVVIFEESGIPTSSDWSMATFDFEGLSDFDITTPTVFNFELLAYCPIDNGAMVSVWDLEEILISAHTILPEGGALEGGPFAFCVGDDMPDMLEPGSIVLSGNSGANSQWVITDDQGNILGLPPMPSAVNFDGAGAGTCKIYHLSYADGLTGLAGGNNIMTDLEGCYNFSNSIDVVRSQPEGGELTTTNANTLNRIVVANRASGTISVINSDNNELEGTYDMPGDGQPMYVVYNAQNNTVLVGDYNGKVAAFDGKTFEHQGSADVGSGVFHMWLSPDNQQLWVNNELDKTISVINPNDLSTTTTFSIPADLLAMDYKPHDVIIMPNNAAAFVTMLGTGDTDYVVKYSATTFEETARVAVGPDPHVSLTSANDKLYVASQGSGELKVLNRSDLSEVASLMVPNAHGLGMNNAGTHLYIGNIAQGGSNANWTMDLSTNTLVGMGVDAPFPAPHNYAIPQGDGKLFVTHSGPTNDKVSIYDLGPTPTLITSITVGNNPFGLVAYTYEDPGSFAFCVGDDMPDMLEPGSVVLSGNSGTNSQWVITDDQGNILGLPPMPSVVNFDDAGAGTCKIYHLSYEDGLTGLAGGNNIMTDLEGCYNFSNSIDVVRSQPEGGVLEGGPFVFCVGDDMPDMLEPGSVVLSENSGANSQWVITDDQGNILGLPPMPSAVNFDDAGAGTCKIYHLSYADGLTGLEGGNNIMTDLEGCFSFSNSIDVVRSQPEGGVLEGGPFAFCVGDDIPDMLETGSVVLSGNSGANSQWVITDDQGNILGLPPMPSAVNFDDAGAGTCKIYHLSYEDGLTGLAGGNNIMTDLEGCYNFSNSIDVVRSQPEGGEILGGPFAFCVGDDIPDMLEPGSVVLSENSGANSQWVITDDQGNILGLPPMPSAVNFDDAGAGTCKIYHLSYEDGLTGLAGGNNIMTDLEGCYNFSNSIDVVRSQPEGGEILGGPFAFCVGDDIPDMLEPGSVVLSGNSGANSQWVITDDQGNILGLPPMPSAVNFDDAGAGTCKIYHLSYEDGLTGLAGGNNIMTDLEGCYNFSNSIDVVRSQPEGGEILGGPFAFCVGDDIPDMLEPGSVVLSGNSGANSQWVITDDQGNILGLPPMPSAVNFDDAGAGTCKIYHLSYEDGLTGLAGGNNIMTDLEGCYNFSNSIDVVRSQPEGGELTTINANTLNRIVVANRASGTISVINSDNNELEGTYDMPDDGQPMYVVYNAQNNTVLVGDYNGKVAAFDGKTFEHQGSADVGNGVFHMWLSPDNQQLWVNNELDKTISVINPNDLSTTTTFSIPADLLAMDYKPHDVIIMPNNAAAFVTMLGTGDTDYVVKYSATTFEETARVAVGPDPHVSLTSANDKLYVASQGSGELKVLNRSDLSEVASLMVPNAHGLGMNNAGTHLYIGNIAEGGSNANWTMDLSTNSLVGLGVDAPFPAPHNYAIPQGDGKLFVTHSGATNDKVSIYDLGPTPTLMTSITVGNNPFGLVAYTYENPGSFEFCVGDDIPDMLEPGSVILSGNNGGESQWVITDEQGNILGLPLMPSAVDFDGAGVAVCQIRFLSYEAGLEGLELGNNIHTGLTGCYGFSNHINVNRIDCGVISNLITINEVNSNDRFELKNTGETTIDISTYWITSSSNSNQLSNLIIECGDDLILEPGELITLVSNFDISEVDGELALFIKNEFEERDNIIDYLEWGSAGHTASAVAINANIWPIGDFVPTFPADQSIESIAATNSSNDWVVNTYSPCTENIVAVKEILDNLMFNLFPNPAGNFINIEFGLKSEGQGSLYIFNSVGDLIQKRRVIFGNSALITLDISGLSAGAYYIKAVSEQLSSSKHFIKLN